LLGRAVKRLYTPNQFLSMNPNQPAMARYGVARLEGALSALCQGVIVVSRLEYEYAIDQLGIAPAKLFLIPNGVALDELGLSGASRAAVRRNWGLRDDEVCVGFVGRLVPQKSPETMLRSFAALRDRAGTPVRLFMIGDGPLAEPLRRLSADLGIAAGVVWLGERDAKTLMHAFDVLALTSDSEGHPIVVLEAMARGLPVVATSVGGISETVRPDVNGFIAPVRAVREIADALAALVANPDLRERMGQASRVMAQDFSVDRMVDKTLALYQQIVSGAREAASSPEWTIASR
jgi:glycosyltransferase involved in cell wall biosynthesis